MIIIEQYQLIAKSKEFRTLVLIKQHKILHVKPNNITPELFTKPFPDPLRLGPMTTLWSQSHFYIKPVRKNLNISVPDGALNAYEQCYIMILKDIYIFMNIILGQQTYRHQTGSYKIFHKQIQVMKTWYKTSLLQSSIT